MKISELYDIVDRIAPFRLASEWDSVGLQVGSLDRNLGSKILLALEVSAPVIAEAKAIGARTIITHHPLFIQPLNDLNEASPIPTLVATLIREGMNLIVAHTNLDHVPDGTNGEIAARLEIVPRNFIRTIEEDAKGKGIYGLGVIGDLAMDTPLGQFAEAAGKAIDSKRVGFVGNSGTRVKRVAICSGAGGDALRSWVPGIAQVLVTGELTHHQCVDARDRGIPVVLLGHYESEVIAMPRLAGHLRKALREKEERIEVHIAKEEQPPVTRV